MNGTSLQLKVFDEPDLKLYSSGQKTILSAYKKDQHGSCKFKFQAVSLGSTAPAQLSAMTFNIGKHPKNRNKFYRSYKMFGPRVLERGVSKVGLVLAFQLSAKLTQTHEYIYIYIYIYIKLFCV